MSQYSYALDLLKESKLLSEKKHTEELAIVSKILVKKELADEYFQYHHMQCDTWWENQKYYHLFMLLLHMRFDGEPEGFWKRIKDKGIELLAETEAVDVR